MLQLPGDGSSRGLTIIIVKQTSQPLAALDRAGHRANVVVRFDQLILKRLMISFLVVMKKVLANSST